MTSVLTIPLLAGLGPSELVIIALIIVLLFGASKLPDLARGSGRALRIFKAETKGLLDDDDDSTKTPEQRQIDAQNQAAAQAQAQRQAHPNPQDTTTPPPGTV